MTQNTILRLLDNERRRKGLSERALAEKAGVGVTAYNHWMLGITSPKLSTIIAIMGALDIEIVLRRRKHDGQADH